MSSIIFRPAQMDRWDDAAAALTGGGDGATCWCQWWLLPNAEWRTTSVDDMRRRLQEELTGTAEAGLPAPALVMYVDDTPAGWVRVGPRTAQPRLTRSVIVKQGTDQPLEDESVWAISCVVVRREFRKQGLMAELVTAAIAHARAGGARVVEAYPVDPAAKTSKTTPNELYYGVASVFEAAGFQTLARPKPARPVMTLTL